MIKRSLIISMLLVTFHLVYAQVPEWYTHELERMDGLWIADNEVYMNDQETDDHYAIEWKWNEEKDELVGVLYGMKAGSKTNEYWTFRHFWNDALGEAHVVQTSFFGAKGEGKLISKSANETNLVQTFTQPDGSVNHEMHKTLIYTDYEISTSYEKNKKGEWVEKRTYQWVKQ